MKREEYPPGCARAIAEAERREVEAMVDGGIATRAALRAGKQLRILPAKNSSAPSFVAKPIARGRATKPRGMNKLEADFGESFLMGNFAWYRYEGITLKLGDDTRYTPDWFAMAHDGSLVCYEVKGPHRREDSIVKLRVAASMYPFRFFLVTRDVDELWDVKEMTP